jgi:MFS family permease
MSGAVTNSLQKGIDFIKRQERTFKINLMRVSSQNFFLYLTQQYQSIYATLLGADPVQLGLLNSIGGLASAAISAPTGWLADRWGIKRVLLFGLPLMALAALIFAVSTNWLMVLPAFLLSMLSLRQVMTVCPMVCGSCLKSEERATGMQLCDTLSAAPRLIAPIFAAFVITAFGGITLEGIKPLYYLQVVGFSVLWLFTLRKFTNPLSRAASRDTSSLVDGIREVLGLGGTVRRWILFICFATVPMFVNTAYLPLFAAEFKGADQFVLSGMATASTFMPLLLSIPIGRLADTFGRKRVIFLLTPIYISSILILVFAPNTTFLIISSILQGVLMLGMVTQGAMTAELVPPSLLGRWYGILGVFRGIVGIVSPLIAGLIWSNVGPAFVFLFIIITEVSKIALLITIPETLKKGDN